MVNLSLEEKIDQIYTVLLGVADTDDRGCVGDIKEIKTSIEILRRDVEEDEKNIAINTKTLWGDGRAEGVVAKLEGLSSRVWWIIGTLGLVGTGGVVEGVRSGFIQKLLATVTGG